MRHVLAKTKNVRTAMAAIRGLMAVPAGLERMGLFWGPAGEGKTTVIAYMANETNGVYLRANAGWTKTSMLQKLVNELGGITSNKTAHLLEACFEKLRGGKRPIFVDEADYLFRQTAMLDALRDIYDETSSPFILIGMETIARKLQNNKELDRFARRITSWVDFNGIDFEDARIVSDTICEVNVDDDLLSHLHMAAGGNIGRLVVGLSRIEHYAKSNGFDSVDKSKWNDRPLFYDQPNFNKKQQKRI